MRLPSRSIWTCPAAARWSGTEAPAAALPATRGCGSRYPRTADRLPGEEGPPHHLRHPPTDPDNRQFLAHSSPARQKMTRVITARSGHSLSVDHSPLWTTPPPHSHSSHQGPGMTGSAAPGGGGTNTDGGTARGRRTGRAARDGPRPRPSSRPDPQPPQPRPTALLTA